MRDISHLVDCSRAAPHAPLVLPLHLNKEAKVLWTGVSFVLFCPRLCSANDLFGH